MEAGEGKKQKEIWQLPAPYLLPSSISDTLGLGQILCARGDKISLPGSGNQAALIPSLVTPVPQAAWATAGFSLVLSGRSSRFVQILYRSDLSVRQILYRSDLSVRQILYRLDPNVRQNLYLNKAI